MLTHVKHALQGKHPINVTRSTKWPTIRKHHLEANPTCALCGSSDNLEVHHVKPFHLNPDLELDPNNLITLCESSKGGVNCHLFFGHLGNYRTGVNANVKADAAEWSKKIVIKK